MTLTLALGLLLFVISLFQSKERIMSLSSSETKVFSPLSSPPVSSTSSSTLDVWFHGCVHPHPSLSIPMCLFDNTWIEDQKFVENDINLYRDGIKWIRDIPASPFPSFQLWERIYQLVAKNAWRPISGLDSVRNSSSSSIYRTGFGFRPLTSSIDVILFYNLNPAWAQELNGFWKSRDYQIWLNLQHAIREWGAATKADSSSSVSNPNSKPPKPPKHSNPFDLYVAERKLTPDQWATLRKVFFVPRVCATEIDIELKKLHLDMETVLHPAKTLSSLSLSTLCFHLATWHQRYMEIMPFTLGNGRVFRLWMAWIMTRFGFSTIPCAPRSDYLRAVRTGVDALAAFFKSQHDAMLLYVGSDGPKADGDHSSQLIKKAVEQVICDEGKGALTDSTKPKGGNLSSVPSTSTPTSPEQLATFVQSLHADGLEQMIKTHTPSKDPPIDWVKVATAASQQGRNDLVYVLYQKGFITTSKTDSSCYPKPLLDCINLLSQWKLI